MPSNLRSVIIFFDDVHQEIEKIRITYDPMYQHIGPHVSLVFPFESDISDKELVSKVKNIVLNNHISPFEVSFDRLGRDENGYIWIEATKGKDNIRTLHDCLYEDSILRQFIRKDIPYRPHITFGQVPLQQANEIIDNINVDKIKFSTTVSKIYIEHILNNEDSDRFATIDL